MAVAAVLDISAGVNAGDALAEDGDMDVFLGLDIAVGVQVQLAFEHAGVGGVTDAEEHEADGECPALAGLLVMELKAFEVLLFDAQTFFDDGVVEEFDLRVGDGALEHDS